MERERIDKLLVVRGLFDTRARAQAAILAGCVQVGGRVVNKPSEPVARDAVIDAYAPHPFVSRGGLKLEAALETFGIDPSGCVALDVGASTGGFTDVLLRRGARRIYAVDVGHGQFHSRLRDEPRVVLMEGTDARTLCPAVIGEPVGVVVTDVSFISLALVLPAILMCADAHAVLVALVKPQFEAGPAHVRKGIVRDPAVHEMVCARVRDLVTDLGWHVIGLRPSPIAGGDGNVEYLLGARRP